MNLFKKLLMLIFILGALLAAGYSLKIMLTQNQNKNPAYFSSSDSPKFINYYINRLDYQFRTTDEDFIISKNSREAIFPLNSNLNEFLNNWTTYERRLYPNDDCKFLRISIPIGQTDLNDNILFACVNLIAEDNFANLSTFK